MPRSSGIYTLPAGQPVVTGTTISSSTFNTLTTDIANEFTRSLASDGQTTPTNNLPMGTYRHTNVGNATARTDYCTAGQSQDNTFDWLTGISGVDTITATAPIALSAYVAGQTFRFVAAGANTTSVTLNINSVGAKAITKNGTTALAAGDILSGSMVEVVYDGTQFQLVAVPKGITALGTAATKDVGTGANQVIQADSSGNYGFGTAPTTVKMTISGSAIVPVTQSYFCYTQDYGIGTPDSLGTQIFAGSADPVRIGKRVSGTFTEYFRSGPVGQWGIGGANYGTAGQVLTSGGSGAPPTWSSINPSTYTATNTSLPAAAAVVSTSHGLGAMPAEAVLEITCTTADGGYSVGDVLQHPHMGNGVGTGWPLSVWKSSSAVGFTLASGFGIGALRKDNGQAFIPNASSWSYRFRLVAA